MFSEYIFVTPGTWTSLFIDRSRRRRFLYKYQYVQNLSLKYECEVMILKRLVGLVPCMIYKFKELRLSIDSLIRNIGKPNYQEVEHN